MRTFSDENRLAVVLYKLITDISLRPACFTKRFW